MVPEALKVRVRNLGFVWVSSRYLRNYASELAETLHVGDYTSLGPSSYGTGSTPGQGLDFGFRSASQGTSDQNSMKFGM